MGARRRARWCRQRVGHGGLLPSRRLRARGGHGCGQRADRGRHRSGDALHATPRARGHGDRDARGDRAGSRRARPRQQQPTLGRTADGDSVQDPAARPAGERRHRAPAARRRARHVHRRGVRRERGRTRGAAVRARSHHSRRQRPTRARARRRGRRRRALLHPRLAGPRATRSCEHGRRSPGFQSDRVRSRGRV
jgi:hypothetical protein